MENMENILLRAYLRKPKPFEKKLVNNGAVINNGYAEAPSNAKFLEIYLLMGKSVISACVPVEIITTETLNLPVTEATAIKVKRVEGTILIQNTLGTTVTMYIYAY